MTRLFMPNLLVSALLSLAQPNRRAAKALDALRVHAPRIEPIDPLEDRLYSVDYTDFDLDLALADVQSRRIAAAKRRRRSLRRRKRKHGAPRGHGRKAGR